MPVTFNERLIAYLALISGLSISAVAVYYSVVGLTAIFAAAAIPIIIMGAVLEISKLIATVWLKQNWTIAPWSVRSYLLAAIITLMLITSMGIFGFLSQAHSDQTLVSGDSLSKLSILDEKIKTEKENIDVARKALKQLDESVDQVMARSSDERGADKAAQIRRSQQRERTALQRDIVTAQSNIARLNEERAPIATEVRKIEAEVGPLKYIAAFVYGETDQTILEKAVTWVIILIVVVFDPLAVILLLASQISFQNFRERQQAATDESFEMREEYDFSNGYVADVGEKPTAEELAEIATEGDSPEKESDVVSTATVTEHHPDTHPYLRQGFVYPPNWEPVKPLVVKTEDPEWQRWVEKGEIPIENSLEQEKVTLQKRAQRLQENVKLYGYSSEKDIVKVAGEDYSLEEFNKLMAEPLYVQNEEQKESSLWNSITQDEYLKAVKQKQEPKE